MDSVRRRGTELDLFRPPSAPAWPSGSRTSRPTGRWPRSRGYRPRWRSPRRSCGSAAPSGACPRPGPRRASPRRGASRPRRRGCAGLSTSALPGAAARGATSRRPPGASAAAASCCRPRRGSWRARRPWRWPTSETSGMWRRDSRRLELNPERISASLRRLWRCCSEEGATAWPSAKCPPRASGGSRQRGLQAEPPWRRLHRRTRRHKGLTPEAAASKYQRMASRKTASQAAPALQQWQSATPGA
mmetsp:Transcript_8028/g.29187  ORF Transcript_8028/g.29187 Transcript_8028/m.29187 type:complete len:245 (+) Transcript_8028:583-1317(+)